LGVGTTLLFDLKPRLIPFFDLLDDLFIGKVLEKRKIKFKLLAYRFVKSCARFRVEGRDDRVNRS
jgi:hypothetical protein